MTGYASVSLLLGRYMKLYADATEFDLGLVFLIHPLAMFLRPVVCARADRYQNHKKLLKMSLLLNSVSYIPLVVLPFLMYREEFIGILTPRVCFWIFVISHIFGSLAFCGVRSLGDSLAVNYAKRIGSSFSAYRKWGSISFGTAGFLLGYINQNWIVPDYVPSIFANVVSLFLLMVLVQHSSDDYFLMVVDSDCIEPSHMNQHQANVEAELSANAAKAKLGYIITPPLGTDLKHPNRRGLPEIQPRDRYSDSEGNHKRVTISQQVRILRVLVEYDIRIPLFLSLLFLGGLVGYAPPNFVYTYMGQVSDEKGIDAAYLSGLTMICYCVVETLFYEIINALKNRLSHSIRLQITLASLSFHYLFYAFALKHLSPYFFLVECLHGVEYSISLSSGVELGYQFANEVTYILPELVRRGIISENDDPEMVRKSLLATMNSIFTLTYEGFGTILGTFIYGMIIDAYSFETAWLLIAILSTAGFFLVAILIMMGRCLRIQPKIVDLQQQTTSATTSQSAI